MNASQAWRSDAYILNFMYHFFPDDSVSSQGVHRNVVPTPMPGPDPGLLMNCFVFYCTLTNVEKSILRGVARYNKLLCFLVELELPD